MGKSRRDTKQKRIPVPRAVGAETIETAVAATSFRAEQQAAGSSSSSSMPARGPSPISRRRPKQAVTSDAAGAGAGASSLDGFLADSVSAAWGAKVGER
jgi:hypothetical protein